MPLDFIRRKLIADLRQFHINRLFRLFRLLSLAGRAAACLHVFIELALPPEDVMVVLGESVGLVADLLQQT